MFQYPNPNERKNRGWLSQKLEEAQREAQKKEEKRKLRENQEKKGSTLPKPPSDTSNSSAPLEKKQGSQSLREEILAKTEGVVSATNLSQILREAKDIRVDPAIVRNFVAIWRQIDELALYHLSVTLPEKEARETWFALSFGEQYQKLRDWLEGGEKRFQPLLQALDVYGQNPFLRDFLYQVVAKFERPLRVISSFSALKGFLEELVEEGLVIPLLNPSYIKEESIQIEEEEQRIVYLPKKVPIVKAAWPFFKEAEERARKGQEKLGDFKKEATPELTPTKISQGNEGILYLALGGGQAVLLRAYKERESMKVAVYKALNIRPEELPNQAVSWNCQLHKPDTNDLKWRRIMKALEKWVERESRREKGNRGKKQESSFSSRINALIRLSTIYPPKALTKLLRGEKGVVAVWHKNFKIEEEIGLFAIAIEGDGEGNYWLREVISDHPFNRVLVGRQLPLEVTIDPTGEKPLQVFLSQNLPKLTKSEFWSLQLVLRLLRYRLNAEREEKNNLSNNH